MTPKNDIIYDVVGIGNAIVDVLAKVGDGFLTERGLDKGAMTLLQAAEAGTIYADLIPEREVSGGSAANRNFSVQSVPPALTSSPNRCCRVRQPAAALFWLPLMPNALCSLISAPHKNSPLTM